MIPQQELQKLIGLPVREKLELARLLIDSSIEATPQTSELPISSEKRKIPFLSLAAMYDGPADTGERADEICQDEIKKRNGATANIPESAAADEQPSAGARWLMEMAGRYSGGPGDTAEHADDICLAELGARIEFKANH